MAVVHRECVTELYEALYRDSREEAIEILRP